MLERIGQLFGKKGTVTHRVLHLSSAHPWTDNRVHWREAVSLSEAGYDVGLYAVAEHVSSPTPVRVTQVAPMHRYKRMSLGTFKALRAALSSRAEIVHIHDPELIWVIPLLRLAGRKVIYDAHEDLPSQVLDKEYLPSAIRKPLGYLSKGLVRVAGMSSSKIIVATETIAKRFDSDKTMLVRNFPRLPDETIESTEIENREPLAVYTGAISTMRGSNEIVEAFSSADMPYGWQLQLAGKISPAHLEELEKIPGWENVEYHGKVSPAESRRMIRQGRVGMVTYKNTVAHRDAMPTKMFEYMAEGTPIIASDFPLWRSIIEKYDCGVLVDENSPESIAAAVRRYAEDEELLKRHSRNALLAAKEVFNWQSEADHLLAAYRSLS